MFRLNSKLVLTEHRYVMAMAMYVNGNKGCFLFLFLEEMNNTYIKYSNLREKKCACPEAVQFFFMNVHFQKKKVEKLLKKEKIGFR